MTTTSASEFTALYHAHTRFTVFDSFKTDELTPVVLYQRLAAYYNDIFFLESGDGEQGSGQDSVLPARFSYLAVDKLGEFRGVAHCAEIDSGEQVTTEHGTLISLMRAYTKSFPCHNTHPMAGGLGGVIGTMNYGAKADMGEASLSSQQRQSKPLVILRRYRKMICFDHKTRTLAYGIMIDKTEHDSAEQAYDSVCTDLAALKMILIEPTKHTLSDPKAEAKTTSAFVPSVSDEAYCQQVAILKNHIRAGDIFQAVLSREFSKKTHASGLAIYRALRAQNPTPFMFYFSHQGEEIIGASPEKLVSVENQIVETCPLAGTRRRGEVSDSELSEELKANEKENAEHMMLVDLARNDVGQVAKVGTVTVPRLREVLTLSQVMHLASTVRGELEEGKDSFDALFACFPAGTLSGAPKHRAMQLIESLEDSPRDLYGGAVFVMDSKGQLTSCIAIRFARLKDGIVTLRAGAGIVDDSMPLAEADETRNKVAALMRAIDSAERGEL